MEEAFDLGEPDFLEPLEMLPADVPTETIQLVIGRTVMGTPFGGSRPMTGEEYDILSQLAHRLALEKSTIPGML